MCGKIRSQVSECGCAMSTGLSRSHRGVLQIGSHFFLVVAIISISYCIHLVNRLSKAFDLEVKPKWCVSYNPTLDRKSVCKL